MDERITTIARDLGVTEVALKKWRQRQSVPHRWRLRILNEARRRGLRFDERKFEQTDGLAV